MGSSASDPTPAVIVDPALRVAASERRDDETMIVDHLEHPHAPSRRVERYVIGGFAGVVVLITVGIALGSRHVDGAPAAATPAPATARVDRVDRVPPVRSTPRADVEQAYRAGVQRFALGDTAAAMAALRSSLAADPDHSPSWRAIGFVYEKQGDAPQARAAYRRYLELTPGAGDAASIRERLERLGS